MKFKTIIFIASKKHEKAKTEYSEDTLFAFFTLII